MSNRIFRFNDDIDTDQLAPGQYMQGGIRAIAQHCLESVRPDFARDVKAGDILIGGRNFGVGSSREQAAEALKYLGVAAVIAPSFAGIFYRNAINLGLPVLIGQVPDQVKDGDFAILDMENSQLCCTTHKLNITLEPLPDNLALLLADGGLVPHLKKRFAAQLNNKSHTKGNS